MQQWKRKLVKSHGIPTWIALLLILAAPVGYVFAVDAPAGYDNLTNGFEPQANFDADLALFDEIEGIDDGLGPVYNAQSCRECHQNPVSGAGSQIAETRAGVFNGSTFSDHPGGSLVNNRAINANIQERILGTDNVAAFRMSLNILGDGFVEALPDSFFTNAQNAQRAAGLSGGTIIRVPVLEAAAGTTAIGRFGWKNQHASLLSFAADAYVNEMGITSKLQPTENTHDGQSVAAFDTVADPEDVATTADPFGVDVGAFTRFMRSTKVPPRDTALAATSDAVAGASIFHNIGCDLCHIQNATTVAAGTSLLGGKLIVSSAIGGKTIHPFSDFLLHNVGTGDGIVQNGGQGTRNMVRTPPLWGLRARNMLLHDGRFETRNFAIQDHFGDANPVINNYLALSVTQANQLITFLNSL
jgi:CxxC motif-containing protein (DUF1111 family)